MVFASGMGTCPGSGGYFHPCCRHWFNVQIPPWYQCVKPAFTYIRALRFSVTAHLCTVYCSTVCFHHRKITKIISYAIMATMRFNCNLCAYTTNSFFSFRKHFVWHHKNDPNFYVACCIDACATDNNNNDDVVDSTNGNSAGCDSSWLPGGAVSKKLIIKPSVSRIDAEVVAPAVAEVVSGRCDAAIDNEDTDSCELPDCDNGLKDVTGNTERFGSETQSTEAVIDVGETDEQTASGSRTRKGRKPGKKLTACGSRTRKGRKPGKKSTAAAGRKGIYDECYSLIAECLLPGMWNIVQNIVLDHWCLYLFFSRCWITCSLRSLVILLLLIVFDVCNFKWYCLFVLSFISMVHVILVCLGLCTNVSFFVVSSMLLLLYISFFLVSL